MMIYNFFSIMFQSRQPLTYRLKGTWTWETHDDHDECGSSQLLNLVIETPGDLVCDLPCQLPGRGLAIYLEGAH